MDNEKKTLSGKVEKLGEKFNGSVSINKKWYSGTKKHPLQGKCSVDDMVNLEFHEYEGKNYVDSIELISNKETAIAESGHKLQPVETTDWTAKELRGIRSMCLAYSKDLVVSKDIEISDLIPMAIKMEEHIYGKEQEIPF